MWKARKGIAKEKRVDSNLLYVVKYGSVNGPSSLALNSIYNLYNFKLVNT